MAAADTAVALSAPPRLRGLRLAHGVSVALLALLALATLASPLLLPMLRPEREALPEAGRIQVVAKPDEWVLQYNLTNRTSQAGAYAFELAASAKSAPDHTSVATPVAPLHTASVTVDAGRTYVFIYHLRPGQVPDGSVRFTVQRGDDATPIEDVTLHLPPSGASR